MILSEHDDMDMYHVCPICVANGTLGRLWPKCGLTGQSGYMPVMWLIGLYGESNVHDVGALDLLCEQNISFLSSYI